MKILSKEIKKGEIKVKIENLDDLWYLSQIIDPKDLVKGRTLRKIKIGDQEDRKTNISKRSIFLEINVEKIEFSKTSNILRVSGIITQAPEEIPLGEHHTFNLEENSEITIKKERWLKFQLDKIQEASEKKQSNILICVHDREEAHFALLKKYGYDILSTIKGKVQKKDVDEQVKTTFYDEILKNVKDYADKYGLNQIIIASPAFWKEELSKHIKDQDLKKKIIFATCSSADKTAIDEVMRRDEVKQALHQERISKEINQVEKLLSEISKDDLAAYGLKQTEEAADAGAIEHLLLTDKFIHKNRENNTYEKIDNIMKLVDSNKGSITIISSEHDGGKRLDGLGGIGAILRYKLNY